MTDNQANQIIDLLAVMAEAMEHLRNDFREFTSYNTMSMTTAVDAITGPIGYSLGDLHSKLDEVIIGLSSVESAVDLK
jgi:hypothetical protein